MVENLKALAVFAKTVEHGSFRAAARALKLSPSVVSHHVGELERKLSLTLLYRSTRRLSLTSDGERLYTAARDMLAAAERGLDAAATPTGALRVTAPALLAETAFARDLAAFARAHPAIRLTVGFTDQRRDLLSDGFDLALRIGRLDDSALRAKRLAVMPRSLVAAPAYTRSRATPHTVHDLEGWDFIQLSALPARYALIPPKRTTPQMFDYEPRIAVDSATAMRTMAIAGLGVAALPALLVAADLARGRLVEVLGSWRLTAMGVYAVWPGGTVRPVATSKFVEFIEPRLAALFA